MLPDWHGEPGLDDADVRSAFAAFPTGVAAVAAEVEGVREVLVVSSFTVGVSLDPPLVLFSVQRSSSTWPRLRRALTLGVSILGESHVDTARVLAGRDRERRFDGIPHTIAANGTIRLDGSPVAFEAGIDTVHPGGDHEIVLLRVHRIHRAEEHRPLLWHGSRTRPLGASVG